MTDAPTQRTVTITRTFNAPRERVFRAWTEVEDLAQWWGPDGYAASVESDPRVGGTLNVVMRGPDGIALPMDAIYLEVQPPELLVVKFTALGADGRHLLEGMLRVTFAERGDHTEITLRTEATALVPEAIAMLGGMSAGWNQSLQCLEDMLNGTVDRQLVVTRLLPVPPDRVFAMWTNPDDLLKWWGPHGFTITHAETDIRPGGTWRFTMHGPDGVDYPNTIVYDEVKAPERLVYTHLQPHFQSIVTFDEMMGMTALTVRLIFDTTHDRDLSVEQYRAQEGAEQTIARLAALIEASAGAS